MATTLRGVTLAVVALLLVGCGASSSRPGVAGLSSHPSSDSPAGGSPLPHGGAPTQQQLVDFSHCMRSHGVPGFPEPSDGHLLIAVGAGAGGIDPRSARFGAAQRACRELLPGGGAPRPALQARAQEGALRFSACMRRHGVPKYPDPTYSGDAVQLRNLGAGRIDPGSPLFRAAQRMCRSPAPALPGVKDGPAEGAGFGVGGPKGGARE
jgi:hypothetical protein